MTILCINLTMQTYPRTSVSTDWRLFMKADLQVVLSSPLFSLVSSVIFKITVFKKKDSFLSNLKRNWILFGLETVQIAQCEIAYLWSPSKWEKKRKEKASFHRTANTVAVYTESEICRGTVYQV